MKDRTHIGLLAEFLFLYIGLPLAVDYNLRTSHVPVIPILVLASVFCLGMLLRDGTFDRNKLWNFAGLRRDAGRIIAVCAVSGAVLTLGVWLWDSQWFMIVAVLLTIAGGWLFATTYRRTGSLAAVSLEHALYGCLVFTVGLGTYFYHGTRLIAEGLMHGS